MKKPQFLSAAEAANLIQDGSTLLTTGFSLLGVAEEIYRAIESRFLETGHPRGLTYVHSAGQTDSTGGMEYLAHSTLLKRVIGSHWGLSKKFVELIAENEIEAFCLPMGQLISTYKATAAGRPGVLSTVGLGTFIDPLVEGGKLNERAVQSGLDLVRRVGVEGTDYLFYPALSYDVFVGRGSTADEDGNISTEDEAAKLELLSAVQAVKKCGGLVVIQVKRLAKAGSLHPKDVTVPGIFVDAVVVSETPLTHHRMTSNWFYNPFLNGELKTSPALTSSESFKLDPLRALIGRRAAQEVQPGYIVNLGVGIPGDAVGIAMEQMGVANQVVMSVESGILGGVPLGGGDFGCAKDTVAIIEKPYQFDFYNGIGVDTAFMGAAEIDRLGNVNVSKFGNRSVGCGGFIDITQSAKTVVFCSTFTARGLEVTFLDNKIQILSEGSQQKFVTDVSQISFSAEWAKAHGQTVVYVTERAVFRLTSSGVELIEVAPGVDIERDIINQMQFRPLVSPELKEMSEHLFQNLADAPKRGKSA